MYGESSWIITSYMWLERGRPKLSEYISFGRNHEDPQNRSNFVQSSLSSHYEDCPWIHIGQILYQLSTILIIIMHTYIMDLLWASRWPLTNLSQISHKPLGDSREPLASLSWTFHEPFANLLWIPCEYLKNLSQTCHESFTNLLRISLMSLS